MANGYFDHPSPYSFGNARSMSDNIKREKEEFKKEELKEELKKDTVFKRCLLCTNSFVSIDDSSFCLNGVPVPIGRWLGEELKRYFKK